MKSSERGIRWKVGELAARFGLATHVLRHWESMGLLTPERDSAGRRLYGESDAYRVATILSSKAAGMSLEQVGALLDSGAKGRHEMLTAHLVELESRMAEMERSRHMTQHALECRAHDIGNCPNFRANVADIVAGTAEGGVSFMDRWRSRHQPMSSTRPSGRHP